MKRTLPLLLLAALASGPLAAADENPGLAAIEKLGRLNGKALACRMVDVATKAKSALINIAPKTQEVGELFDNATNRTFLSPGSCGEKQRLQTEVEATIVELRLAYPAARHDTSVPETQAEVMPRYILVDHNNRPVRDDDFRGRFQLITFGYTFCPDVCPTTLSEVATVMRELGDGAQRIQPIFVSVDPERDTPAALKTYTGFFDSRILGMTGTPEVIRRVADNFKVRYEKVREPGAPPERYSMDHTAGMYLIGPDGRFLAKFPYAMPVQELVSRIRDYLKVTR